MKNLNSTRMYCFAFVEGNLAIEVNDQSLQMIIDALGDFEFYYAIHERIDEVLDLKPGEFLQMNFNRDAQAPGFIKRLIL